MLDTVLVAGVPWIALLLPVVLFLSSGWKLRRREILTSFTDDATMCYFQTFYPEEFKAQLGTEFTSPAVYEGADSTKLTDTARSRLRAQLNRQHAECFGRERFILPGMLIAIVAGGLLWGCAHLIRPEFRSWLDPAATHRPAMRVLTVISGVIGGYVWVFQYLVSKAQQRQMSPYDLLWGSFRLIISGPIAMAIATLFTGALQPAIALMLGAFPTKTLMTVVRRTAAAKLGSQEEEDDSAKSLTILQGISREQAEIYLAEGAGSILQLAYADPVDLTIRTGFSFSYVVDCCSQALAWLCFEDSMPKLRRLSLRGAMEVATFVLELDGKLGEDSAAREQERLRAEQTLTVLSADLGIQRDVLRRAFDEVAWDPYTQFLRNVWQPNWS